MKQSKFKIDDVTFHIRALTRGEIKKLKKYGYTYVGCALIVDTAEAAQEECLEMILSSDEMNLLDACTIPDIRRLWMEILKETYGAPDEEKNSQSTSSGTQTKTE